MKLLHSTKDSKMWAILSHSQVLALNKTEGKHSLLAQHLGEDLESRTLLTWERDERWNLRHDNTNDFSFVNLLLNI